MLSSFAGSEFDDKGFDRTFELCGSDLFQREELQGHELQGITGTGITGTELQGRITGTGQNYRNYRDIGITGT